MNINNSINKMLGLSSKGKPKTSMRKPKPKEEFVVSGKKVQVFNDYPIPSKKQIKKVYDKIPDDQNIPLQFMTRKQYLKKYALNQSEKNGTNFSKQDIKKYKQESMPKYKHIVGRYTTKSNPYYKPAVVVFNDPDNQKNIKGKKFDELAWHEYGHELAEKKKLGLCLKKEEMFADGIAKKGMKVKVFSDTRAKNKVLKEIRKDEYSRNMTPKEKRNLLKRGQKYPIERTYDDMGRILTYVVRKNGRTYEYNTLDEARLMAWEPDELEEDEYSRNTTQTLYHAGDKPPSETLKEQGRVYGFSNLEYAQGWQEKEDKKDIYQFTTDEYDLDDKTYVRDTPKGKKYSDNEYISRRVIREVKL